MSFPISGPYTPKALGYSMPAEWSPHAATWLTFPRREGISFPDKFDPIPAYWVKMAELLSPGEEVHINVFSSEHETEVRGYFAAAGVELGRRIILHRFPAYEPWCRDHGPIFLKRGAERAVVDWGYNAWGDKYPPYDLDDAIPQHVAQYRGLPLFTAGIVMEGGSLEVNGEGTVLTTTSCLLNKNRNPGLSQAEIETWLCQYLGAEKILWLGDGIEGDDTDGHIDDITRFVGPKTVVTAVEEDPSDFNYELLRENRRRLETMTTAKGERLEIVDLPMPGRIEHDGQRLPASYANFYIGNEVVLLPVYRHANDDKAREILQKIFSTRKVIPVDCTDLIWGLGAFHCVTQQEPA
jgi:agmatine deiminase